MAYEFVTSEGRFSSLAHKIRTAPSLGIDLETTSLDPRNGRVRILSIALPGDPIERYVVDLFQTGMPDPIVAALNNPQAQTGDRPLVIGQNLKFDQKWLLDKYGIRVWPLFDTYRASAVLHAGRHKENDLWSLYRRELDLEPSVPDLGGSNWSATLTQSQLDYAADDISHLFALKDALREKLSKSHLLQTALVEFQALLPEASMELNGFYLDQSRWKDLYVKNESRTQQLRGELSQKLPHPTGQLSLFQEEGSIFNFDSPDQISKSLLRLGLKIDDTSKTSLAMAAAEYPVVDLVLKYREYSKRCSSFGEDYLKWVDPKTGRIHTSFYPYTDAGRYASSQPNTQQIPRTKDFRHCFCAPPGKILIVCDYSQVELRLVAEVACDHRMIEIYRNNGDIHAHTASIVCLVPLDKVTKEQRQLAKPVNFGLVYGLGPKKLILYARANYGIVLSESQATDFCKRYFEEYAGVNLWHKVALAEGKRRRQTRTLWGRRRWIDDEKAHNEFYNSPIQGCGADGLKRALWFVYNRLQKYGDRVKMVHMVHDEVVLEVDDDLELVSVVQAELEAGMIEGLEGILKRVPIVAEAHHGYSWAEAK